MVGNSWGLKKLGRDDLGDFSIKKNNACSSAEKTSKSSRLAFLNADLGLPYCRRETKRMSPMSTMLEQRQCAQVADLAERSKAVAQGAIP